MHFIFFNFLFFPIIFILKGANVCLFKKFLKGLKYTPPPIGSKIFIGPGLKCISLRNQGFKLSYEKRKSFFAFFSCDFHLAIFFFIRSRLITLQKLILFIGQLKTLNCGLNVKNLLHIIFDYRS
jgi:hypothetical protein